MDNVKFKTLWKKLLNKNEDIRGTYKPHETFSNDITIPNEKLVETFSNDKTIIPSEKFDSKKTKIDVPLDSSQDYVDLIEINRGGMGIIYQAKQKKLKRHIAIKKMLSAKEKEKEKFLAESLVNAYLEHPNIVPVHEIDENEKGEILLAMKLVQGTSWKNLLYPKTLQQKEKASRYSLQGHLQILLNVCNAIAYAHSKNIVHCDLKPENVMIGEFGEVLVMDWGIAVDLSSHQDREQEIRTFKNTEIQHPMGTPCYISPELAEGRGKDISYATDVYLLGGILYEILHRRPPHQGSSIWQVLLSAKEGTIPTFDDEVSSELKAICIKALQGEIKKRYQVIADFQKDIQAFLEHQKSLMISEDSQKIIDELQHYHKNPEILESKQKALTYRKISQAIFGFEQALNLWEENQQALNGYTNSSLLYAALAIVNEDFGLAELQLVGLEDEESEKLHKKIKEGRDRNERIYEEHDKLQKQLLEQYIEGYNQLAQTSLSKGQEAYDLIIKEVEKNKKQESIYDAKKIERLYNQCFTYAIKSFEFIQLIKGKNDKDYSNIIKKQQALVLSSMNRYYSHIVWKTTCIHNRPVVNDLQYSPDGKFFASASGQMQIDERVPNIVVIWNALSGKPHLTMEGHSELVTSVAYSPDGKFIASGSMDGSVIIWDTNFGRQVCKLKHSCDVTSMAYSPNGKLKHSCDVTSVAYSPNGKFVVCGLENNNIQIWDVILQKSTLIFKGHNGLVTSVAYSPDGKFIASASEDQSVIIWSIDSQKQVCCMQGHEAMVTSVAYSPDGKFIASASEDQSVIIWSIDSQKQVYRIQEHTDMVRSVVYSPDGKFVASASHDGTIVLWNTISKKVEFTFIHGSKVNAVTFNPSGEFLLSGSKHSVRLWNRASSKRISMYEGHTDEIKSLAFYPNNDSIIAISDQVVSLWKFGELVLTNTNLDCNLMSVTYTGEYIAVVGSKKLGDTKLFLLNTKSLKKFRSVKLSSCSSNSIAFHPNGKIVAFLAYHVVKFVNIGLGREVPTKDELVSLDIRGVESVVFSPDGKILASYSYYGLALWDFTSGKQIRELEVKTEEIYELIFSSDGRILACTSYNNVILWNVSSSEIFEFTGHSQKVKHLASGGELFASASEKEVRIWDHFGKQVAILEEHTSQITAIEFSKDGRFLISGARDGTIIMWDTLFPDRKIKTIGNLNVDTFHLTSDNQLFGISSNDKVIKIWDIEKRHSFSEIDVNSSRDSVINSVAISPNNQLLACGLGGKLQWTDDNTIRIFNLSSQKQIFSFKAHLNTVSSLSFSSDNKILASASIDQSIILWDIVLGKQKAILNQHTSSINCVVFSPNSKLLASGSGLFNGTDLTVRIWDVRYSKQILVLNGHTGLGIGCISFSPNNELLASASKEIIIWNVVSGEQILTLACDGIISSLVFSPDSRLIIAAISEEENEIKVWDVNSGKEVYSVSQNDDIKALIFREKTLISSSDDGSIYFWDILYKNLPQIPIRSQSLDKNKLMTWFVDHFLANQEMYLYDNDGKIDNENLSFVEQRNNKKLWSHLEISNEEVLDRNFHFEGSVAKLVNKGKTFFIYRTPFTIGRHPENNLFVKAPKISRYHAQIVRNENTFFLLDLNSQNGTYVLGKGTYEKIESYKKIPLSSGMTFCLDKNEQQYFTFWIV